METMHTVRKTFIDCSNFMINFSKPSDEVSGCFPLSPLPPFSGELLGWNDSSTATFSSFSCRIVAWILCEYLGWILKEIKIITEEKLSPAKKSASI